MSDTTPETTDAAAAPAGIDFERAEFAEPRGEHVACGLCKQAIRVEYWQYLGKVLCESCKELVRRTVAAGGGGVAMGKALLYGGGVALGCGIGYAIFVGVSKMQVALLTIGIGWAVGRAIQRATRGFGNVRHQVLAVVLTYFASAMGTAPAVTTALLGGMRSAQHDADTSVDAGTRAAPAPSAPDVPPAPAAPAPSAGESAEGPGLLASLAMLVGLIVGLSLLAPILEITSGFSGILGALIIFFGLRTAWRMSKGVTGEITGPHQVSTSTAP